MTNLGDLGRYQVINKEFVLKEPGRKYSPTKDSKTRLPNEYHIDDLDPTLVKVGDIIDVGHYRKENSYIVSLDDNKRLVLIRLPDEGHSGYGTIPLSVSSFFPNAITAYKDVDDIDRVHLSPKDEGLQILFFHGQPVPQQYRYVYRPSADEVDIFDPKTGKALTINRSGKKTGAFLKSFFMKKQEIPVKVLVEFRYNKNRESQLEQQTDEQKYQSLRRKYSQEANDFKTKKFSQLQDILIKNNISQERGSSGGGSYHSFRNYILSGTKTSLDKTLKELKKINQTNGIGSFTIHFKQQSLLDPKVKTTQQNKILNPATGRYVLKTGKIGKALLAKKEKI